jgi:hypothetical protein
MGTSISTTDEKKVIAGSVCQSHKHGDDMTFVLIMHIFSQYDWLETMDTGCQT